MKNKNTVTKKVAPIETIGSYPIRVLRKTEVLTITGLSNTGIFELTKAGFFPTKIPISNRCIGYYEHEIHALINARAAGRSDKQIRELVTLMIAKRKEQADAFLADLVA